MSQNNTTNKLKSFNEALGKKNIQPGKHLTPA